MDKYKLGEKEQRFAELIWEREPIPSGELVKLCEIEFEWKKSTTYTMLKRLCQRGIFENESGMVSAVMSKEDFLSDQSEKFISDTFEGSLPRFLAAFTKRKKISSKEIDEIQKLIDDYKED
ncbi:MAG: BlaI/MecI/CopY family transcriptional regulator [Firmicutes bacterium]|jgi:predicted transcriptional regulator|nr:BlaI/MecI/CopY family transcriptional regulator [Bacillota bacterium]